MSQINIKIKRKNILAISGIICAIIIGVILFLVICRNSLFSDEWAIYNYGQTVEGQKGIKGLDINILPAWRINQGSSEIIIAVVDTGIDTSCEILENNEILSGWDFYNNDSSVYDSYLYDYHGTYVCTTIAKIAPNISILPVKFMESTSGSVDDAVKAIQYAIAQGADIINCSWNFYEYDEDLYNIIYNNPDTLFICAAGNYSANLDDISIYPCSYQLDNMINVLAIDNTGHVFRTSGYGKNTVHIAAPGASIKVIFPENNITYIDGTSVAAAFVSATAGLILSEDETLSPIEIKKILLSSSTPIEGLESKCVSSGLLNVYKSITKWEH